MRPTTKIIIAIIINFNYVIHIQVASLIDRHRDASIMIVFWMVECDFD